MIVTVGAPGPFYFMRPDKRIFYHTDDPLNGIYNEMCGHRWLMDHIEWFEHEPYLGLEHYRRAFDHTPEEIDQLLDEHDIIVKNEHGPLGCTNLQALQCCSRYGINYLPQATQWVERWPELREQAERDRHYGCCMFITRPDRYKEMMSDAFKYIDEMLKYPNLQRSVIGYFCELILVPFIVKAHNRDIFVGRVTVK